MTTKTEPKTEPSAHVPPTAGAAAGADTEAGTMVHLALLRAGLPARNTTRWVASRKAAVVNAVNAGALDEAEAVSRYGLTAEEFAAWRVGLASHGARGLYATRIMRAVPICHDQVERDHGHTQG